MAPLAGEPVDMDLAMNANNSVFDAKRLIKCKFSDAGVQSDMKHWATRMVSLSKCRVSPSTGGTPVIEVEYKDEKEQVKAEEIRSTSEGDANENLVEAKNGLESYCGSPGSSIEGEEAEDNITKEDLDAINDTISRLEANLTAEREDLDEKQKALERTRAWHRRANFEAELEEQKALDRTRAWHRRRSGRGWRR